MGWLSMFCHHFFGWFVVGLRASLAFATFACHMCSPSTIPPFPAKPIV